MSGRRKGSEQQRAINGVPTCLSCGHRLFMQAMMEFQHLSCGATPFISFLIHLTLLFSSLLQSTASTSLPLSGNTTDQLALLAFKDHITEDPFQALSSWNESLHFCLWRGINCSRRHHQRVTTLNLTGLGLGGFISPFIGNLSFLRAIDLYDNHFTGNIPNEMGRLSRLRYVGLDQNSLRGEIPSNLSHCQRLRLIDFSSNQLVGRIPVALAALSNLVVLYLGKNSLSGGISPSFGNLSALTHLSLRYNRLEGNIPEDLKYGISGQISTHGDVYSYGILLLEMFIGKKPTDEMFKEGLNFHQFVSMALPDQVMKIIDPRLLMIEAKGLNENQSQSNTKEGIVRCLVSVIRIGMCCSMTSPNERKEIRDVMIEMHSIKDLYLRDRNRID